MAPIGLRLRFNNTASLRMIKQAQPRLSPGARQNIKLRHIDTMPLATDQDGQKALLGLRESGHVGIFGDVGTVSLVAVMRNIQPDLVQACRPVEHQSGQFTGKTPRAFAFAGPGMPPWLETRDACSASTWKRAAMRTHRAFARVLML